ncbi:MAG TPA: sulfurtransferase [Phycisphaerales bacterium]|nr:sulfurtransferase [Phycisphaerales bacterium]
MHDYAHPEVLVSTSWVRDNLSNPKVKLAEIDVDTKQYDVGHIPGAIGWNWQTQLQDQLSRDIIDASTFERLMSESGIEPKDTVVLYGDNNNWFAAYGLWLLKYYGHEDVRLMNGGRSKWLAEEDKPFTNEKPTPKKTTYKIVQTHPEVRARIAEVIQNVNGSSANLIDVRSPDEFSGKVIAPPGMTETAQRGGHIPGAKSVPWSKAVNQDGTFKSAQELAQLYLKEAGVQEGKPTIAYCRIGERSSHSWFVLKYLLGLPDVKNYDGSWTEYGNLVGVPIEKSV